MPSFIEIRDHGMVELTCTADNVVIELLERTILNHPGC